MREKMSLIFYGDMKFEWVITAYSLLYRNERSYHGLGLAFGNREGRGKDVRT
jgi:hypothetical protein